MDKAKLDAMRDRHRMGRWCDDNKQLRLREVIDVLQCFPRDFKVAVGFCAGDSYRGYYNQIAFAPATDTTVGQMLEHAKACDGATFTGYKGGDYTMGLDTDCNIAEYGDCSAEDEVTQRRLFDLIQGWPHTTLKTDTASALDHIDELRAALKDLVMDLQTDSFSVDHMGRALALLGEGE